MKQEQAEYKQDVIYYIRDLENNLEDEKELVRVCRDIYYNQMHFLENNLIALNENIKAIFIRIFNIFSNIVNTLNKSELDVIALSCKSLVGSNFLKTYIPKRNNHILAMEILKILDTMA